MAVGLTREQVAATAEPAERARLASELVTWCQHEMAEASRIRREALEELISQGLTHAQIAQLIGTTRARVGQLLTSGPRPERAFLGAGALVIALGGKIETGRRDTRVQPVASADAIRAYEALAEAARHIGLDATLEVIPPPGLIDLNRPNLVALTSPRLLPFVGQVLAVDKRFGFQQDAEGWFLVDRQLGAEYRTPDDGKHAHDYAYIGRLPRPDGRGTFLYLAGIHSLGTLGAARYVVDHLGDLYSEVKVKRFSFLVECISSGANGSITATPITPICRHEGV